MPERFPLRMAIRCAALLVLVSLVVPAAWAEPLQNERFVILAPQGTMGKSPLYPVFRTADSSDPWAKKLYDSIQSDPKLQEVLQLYRAAQDRSNRSYAERLRKEGKSEADVEKALAARATPIYFILKDGKATPRMDSGSAFIQTWKNGRIDTDFQYVCPKVTIFSEWEGFRSPKDKPFTDSERRDFANLVAHETSHAVMKETYGYIPKGVNPFAAIGHWEGKETTQQLAFTEGYAEFMGAWYSGSDDFSAGRYSKDEVSGMPKTAAENRRTEGVAASIFWDIAKGEGGIASGMVKIHQVLAARKPWTIEGFAKGFKELFPGDARAIDRIMRQNLIPEADPLPICWLNLSLIKRTVASLQAEYDKLSWLASPVAKAKLGWKLLQERSSYDKMLKRYQSLYGYSKERLTAPTMPRPPQPQAPVPAATKPVPVSVQSPGQSPFAE